MPVLIVDVADWDRRHVFEQLRNFCVYKIDTFKTTLAEEGILTLKGKKDADWDFEENVSLAERKSVKIAFRKRWVMAVGDVFAMLKFATMQTFRQNRFLDATIYEDQLQWTVESINELVLDDIRPHEGIHGKLLQYVGVFKKELSDFVEELRENQVFSWDLDLIEEYIENKNEELVDNLVEAIVKREDDKADKALEKEEKEKDMKKRREQMFDADGNRIGYLGNISVGPKRTFQPADYVQYVENYEPDLDAEECAVAIYGMYAQGEVFEKEAFVPFNAAVGGRNKPAADPVIEDGV